MFRQIELFQKLVENNDLKKSCEEIGQSHSRFYQHQIQALESYLGTKLLESMDPVKLTQPGKYFYENSLPIMEALKNLLEEVSQMEDDSGDTLRIVCANCAYHQEVRNTLDQFEKEHPNLHIQLDFSKAGRIHHLVQHNHYDMGLMPISTVHKEEYSYHPLLPLYLQVQIPGILENGQRALPCHLLQNQECLYLYHEGDLEVEEEICKDLEIQPNMVELKEFKKKEHPEQVPYLVYFGKEGIVHQKNTNSYLITKEGAPVIREIGVVWKKDNPSKINTLLAQYMKDSLEKI